MKQSYASYMERCGYGMVVYIGFLSVTSLKGDFLEQEPGE